MVDEALRAEMNDSDAKDRFIQEVFEMMDLAREIVNRFVEVRVPGGPDFHEIGQAIPMISAVLANRKLAGIYGQPKDSKRRFDAFVATQGFRDLMEELCGHVEANFEPEILFDAIQRRYQQNDPTVAEFIDFVSWNPWLSAMAAFKPCIKSEQLATLSRAESYYEKIRTLVNLMKSSAMKQWQRYERENRP